MQRGCVYLGLHNTINSTGESKNIKKGGRNNLELSHLAKKTLKKEKFSQEPLYRKRKISYNANTKRENSICFYGSYADGHVGE